MGNLPYGPWSIFWRPQRIDSPVTAPWQRTARSAIGDFCRIEGPAPWRTASATYQHPASHSRPGFTWNNSGDKLLVRPGLESAALGKRRNGILLVTANTQIQENTQNPKEVGKFAPTHIPGTRNRRGHEPGIPGFDEGPQTGGKRCG